MIKYFRFSTWYGGLLRRCIGTIDFFGGGGEDCQFSSVSVSNIKNLAIRGPLPPQPKPISFPDPDNNVINAHVDHFHFSRIILRITSTPSLQQLHRLWVPTFESQCCYCPCWCWCRCQCRCQWWYWWWWWSPAMTASGLNTWLEPGLQPKRERGG